MKKLLFIIAILFSSNVSADWISAYVMLKNRLSYYCEKSTYESLIVKNKINGKTAKLNCNLFYLNPIDKEFYRVTHTPVGDPNSLDYKMKMADFEYNQKIMGYKEVSSILSSIDIDNYDDLIISENSQKNTTESNGNTPTSSKLYLKQFSKHKGYSKLTFERLSQEEVNNSNMFVFYHYIFEFSDKLNFKNFYKAVIILDCNQGEKPFGVTKYKINNDILVSHGEIKKGLVNDKKYNFYCGKSDAETKMSFELIGDAVEKITISNFSERELKMRKKAFDIMKLNEQRL